MVRRTRLEDLTELIKDYSIDGDVGYGVPGSPLWNYQWIMQLEDDELCDFVLEIGSDKAFEALEYANSH